MATDPIIEVPSGLNVNKEGGDAMAGSMAVSGAFGEAEQCGGGGGYLGGGSSASAGDMIGAGSIAATGGAMAGAGDGGNDQTSIGDITINT